MKINNNIDSKATPQLNYEIHSENCQTSKVEFSLGNSQRLKSTSHFCKENPSQMNYVLCFFYVQLVTLNDSMPFYYFFHYFNDILIVTAFKQ